MQIFQAEVHITVMELFWLMSSDQMMVESKDELFSSSVADAGFLW